MSLNHFLPQLGEFLRLSLKVFQKDPVLVSFFNSLVVELWAIRADVDVKAAGCPAGQKGC